MHGREADMVMRSEVARAAIPGFAGGGFAKDADAGVGCGCRQTSSTESQGNVRETCQSNRPMLVAIAHCCARPCLWAICWFARLLRE